MTSGSSSQPLIRCNGVSVSFRSNHQEQSVLRDLSMQVDAGSIFTLLGPSGCGKSTLLRVLAGLLHPTTGDVVIDGMTYDTHRHQIQSMLSFVFQEASLLSWRTVWENVCLPLELRCEKSKSQIREAASHWLRIVGLNESDWKKRPSQLSGGMKMRASIARAMTTNPKILLMDEPFAALDDVLRSRLNDLLLEIAKTEGCTVVFVTHNIAEAVFLSDSIAVMHRGQLLETIPVTFSSARNAELRSSTPFAETFGLVSGVLFRTATLQGV